MKTLHLSAVPSAVWYSIASIGVAWFLLLVLRRKTKAELAHDIAEKFQNECDRRQVALGDGDMCGFDYFLIGDQPGQHRVWAFVRLSKTSRPDVTLMRSNLATDADFDLMHRIHEILKHAQYVSLLDPMFYPQPAEPEPKKEEQLA